MLRLRIRLGKSGLRTAGLVGLALGAGLLIGASVVRPMAAGTAVAGAIRSNRLGFRDGSPFQIVIQRNDGKTWNNITSASCQFKQAGVATPVPWLWTAGDASIHQNTKFVTLKFAARRAVGGMALTSGQLVLTVTDSVNGPVDTNGTTINVDEMILDPCPPLVEPPIKPPVGN